MTRTLSPSDMLATLRERFRARSRERLARLGMLAGLREGQRPALAATATLEEVRRLLHELAGGAGTFGFPALGAEAARLEASISKAGDAPLAELRAALPRMEALLADSPEAHGRDDGIAPPFPSDGAEGSASGHR
ncbi:hypothetical protein HRbin40_01522 [bacterium HR40]|nr:hypothetical protein HRbin40_01522 [bacterium HR40]